MIPYTQNFNLYKKISRDEAIKMVAFGSSSTQRFMCGMHWFDYVELGFKNCFSHKVGQFINSGVSNDSTVELLARFEGECAAYQPDLVILTVGANDCRLGHAPEFFESNLHRLRDNIRGLGADLVLQTFYPIDSERAHSWWLGIDKYVEVARKFAVQTDTPLVDTAQRWRPMRDLHIDVYRTLLRDLGHLNELGNMVLGLDLIRFFNVGLLMKDKQIDYCREGIVLQYMLDSLNRPSSATGPIPAAS